MRTETYESGYYPDADPCEQCGHVPYLSLYWDGESIEYDDSLSCFGGGLYHGESPDAFFTWAAHAVIAPDARALIEEFKEWLYQ